MLISALLNKEYTKRPNIFEFARIPCVNKSIRKFVIDNNLREEVLNIFDIKQKGVEDSADTEKTPSEEETKEDE